MRPALAREVLRSPIPQLFLILVVLDTIVVGSAAPRADSSVHRVFLS